MQSGAFLSHGDAAGNLKVFSNRTFILFYKVIEEGTHNAAEDNHNNNKLPSILLTKPSREENQNEYYHENIELQPLEPAKDTVQQVQSPGFKKLVVTRVEEQRLSNFGQSLLIAGLCFGCRF